MQCVVAVGTVQCATRSDSPRLSPADTLMECRAADIRHVLQHPPCVSAGRRCSFTPAGPAPLTCRGPTTGCSSTSRDNHDLVLRFDATNREGTRLFDDEQQAIQGHGGTDDIVCTRD